MAHAEHQREADYEFARSLTRQYGTSYYFATRFFPLEKRRATYALYAFVRVPDEWVDNPRASLTIPEIEERLQEWQEAWREAYTTGSSTHSVLRLAAETFHTYQIPAEYGESFLEAMKQDLSVTRYQTYQDLKEYMYGSAVVVGLMMSHVIGFQNGALPHAQALGEAMQMTNFLRDIREDYEERGRIYLPQEDMDRFGVTEDHLKDRQCDENFRTLIQYEIKRTRELYAFANQGISLLAPEGQFAVQMASSLYEAILDKIEQIECDVFRSRVRTNRWEKGLILAREWKKHSLLKYGIIHKVYK